jgi:excisionase family DNA binding protein
MARDRSTVTPLPELLSPAEVAAYLDVPVSTIHFWRGKGQGPSVFKVGKRLRFRASDVASWLEEQKGGDAAA